MFSLNGSRSSRRRIKVTMIALLARKHWYRLRSIWTMLAGFDDPWQTIAVFTGRAGAGEKTIRLRETDLRFVVRGPMDVWCLKETHLDRVYQRFGFPIEPGWTVLDIGAGIGDFTVLAARAAPQGLVYAFEPYPESFALLRENVERNQAANALLFPTAVTGRPRTLTLDTSSGEPLMVASVDATAADAGMAISSTTLAEFVNQHGIERIDLLKLDCEGAEYDILLNSPACVFDRVQRIAMEYHDHMTPHTHHELVDFLAGAGFRVEISPSPVHPTKIGYLRARH